MLFSFHGGEADPMRVSVFQALANNENGEEGEDGGRWIDWKDCPYDKMWADDIIWLPQILQPMTAGWRLKLQFEGHFVFEEKGPGPSAKLLRHNCQFAEFEE